MICALAFLAALILIYFFASPVKYDQKGRTVKYTCPIETIQMNNGISVVNDSAVALYYIDSSGKAVHRITTRGDDSITGTTSDDSGNLYMWYSVAKNGGSDIIRDEIRKYDSHGKLKATIGTIDYSKTKAADDVSCRTSGLRYSNGYICYAVYRKSGTDLYRIKLSTGKTSLIGTLKNDSVFSYNDVYVRYDGSYYYARSSGEVGEGRIGHGQKVLAVAHYNIRTGSGIRPFYVVPFKNRLYVFDYWLGTMYQVKNGSFVQPEFSNNGDIALNEDGYYINELSCNNGTLTGITGNTPWYVKGNTIHVMKDSVQVSFLSVISRWLTVIKDKIALPLIIILSVYILIFILLYIFKAGHKFFWKLLAASLLLFLLFGASVYLLFTNEHQTYIKESLSSQKKEATLAAQNISAADLEKIDSSSALNSSDYNRINNKLIDNFSIFQNNSDTAAMVFVPGSYDGEYIFAASNRGYSDILGTKDEFTAIINKTIKSDTHVYGTIKNKMMISCAEITDSSNRTAGFLVLYTAEKNISLQFIDLWSLPLILLCILAMIIFLIISSAVISRSMRSLSMTIRSIISGDYSVRLHNLPNDEIGEVGRCVNTLSENIERLIDENSRMNLTIQKSQEDVLISLASITEIKSGQTANHVKRVSRYVAILSEDFGLTPLEVRYVSTASMLHDIGKLFTPNEILEKPGRLDSEELQIMKEHAADGEKLLHNGTGAIVKYARTIALEHHEKWDGTGYPRGLKGDAIHLESRITAIADVFDALVSIRSYKGAYPLDEAYGIIISERGTHFDPDVVDAFSRHFEEFSEIAKSYPDSAVADK